MKVAYAYTNNTCDAEDIVQETFLSLMTEKKNFLSQEHMKAWLIRVTINKCKNHIKSAWISKRTLMSEKSDSLSQEENELSDAVFSLEEKYRIPIYLFYYEGYSIAEIAKIMGKKPAAIGSWLDRGRKKLKKQLNGIFSLGVILFICIAGIFYLTKSHSKNIDDDIFAQEEITGTSEIESAEIVRLEDAGGFYETHGKVLQAGETLILDCDRIISNGDTIFLRGAMEGADISYDVGYLINGKYSYLQKNLSDDIVDYSVAAGERGDFYWCITNRSECEVSFSGTVQYDSNDLVYRFYGNDVISVDSSCTIRIENIQVLLASNEIKNICIYHYEENAAKMFSPETREFRIEQKGTYSIFAATDVGETVSLNQNVSVEFEVNNVIIEDGNGGKTAPRRGKYM